MSRSNPLGDSTALDPTKSMVIPWFLGAGYVGYGLAVMFMPKNSKAFAIATGVFGAAVLGHAVVLFRKASESAPTTSGLGNILEGGGRPGLLGESIQESVARTAGQTHGGPVNAPTLEDRIRIIKDLARKGAADPEVRNKALAVLTRTTGVGPNRKWEVPEKNWTAEVKALQDAFNDPASGVGVRYVRDPLPLDTYVAAKKTLRLQGGDCDDHVITLGALLMSVGYRCRARVVQGANSDSWSHIHLQAAGNPPGGGPVKTWIPIDTTVRGKPFGWQAEKPLIKKEALFEL
jgi:hypothetical protein